VDLAHTDAYEGRGLARGAIDRLRILGDLLINAPFNVTSIRKSEEIELFHFLDCLALLDLPVVRSAAKLADLGSGAGLPALILALALPSASVVAVESQHKKCGFIEETASAMGLSNVRVCCARIEEYGRGTGRMRHDAVVSRALAALPVVAEYSLPLLQPGGAMVAMKGEISIEERIRAQKALDILGAGELESARLEPFAGAQNRWVYLAAKVKSTPAAYPRRPGLPARRPLGE
jgi:16S rRNA (guanine527-N7)-methyltransferase